MGKHSNIILTNSDNIIIESLKNSYSLEFSRSTISNMEYVLPPTVKKYNPFNFSEYSDLICDKNDKKFLIKNFYGVSSVLNNYFLNIEEDALESFREFCKNFSYVLLKYFLMYSYSFLKELFPSAKECYSTISKAVSLFLFL